MFRKLTLLAIPATAFALTMFASVDSSSQAFAKGGKGAPMARRAGMSREFRRNWRKDFRYNRYYDRFCFGYPVFGCVEAPGYSEVVTPVVETTAVVEAPIVEAPVVTAPVCTTYEPVCSTYTVGPEWGYRHFRKDFPRRERPFQQGDRMARGKK